MYAKDKKENGKWYLGTTKTINEVRKVYICDTLLIALNNYKNKQDYFKKLYGKIIEYRIFKIIKKFNLGFRIENCRFYDLRGSYATKSLRNGVEIRDVADILGHSKIEATENNYVTTTEETLKEAREKFEEMAKSDAIDEIIKYE